MRTARAKGAPEWLVMRSHVLRNALLPVVTMLGMDIGIALGGAIFTESVYGLPGLGKTAIKRSSNFDLPITQGVVVFATLVHHHVQPVRRPPVRRGSTHELDSRRLWPSSKSTT